ncbi:MAG: hypothetical protein EOP49_18690 [Sphingobacteriales bacterium]|nr:MAG: hypothetical protein EOP49_18690 [Sphingobacteriales bacterium]
MKKILKIIGIILLLVIAFVLIAAIFVPKTVHLERSTVINASPEKIWPLVSSFPNHTRWSPFIKEDPNVVIGYTGKAGTVGSGYNWKGNSDVGSGEQSMTKLDPYKRVDTHLHFIEPFEGEAEAFIILSPETNATKTTWGFDSKYPYPMNAMLLFIDLEDALGKSYEDGLSQLKRLAEQ